MSVSSVVHVVDVQLSLMLLRIDILTTLCSRQLVHMLQNSCFYCS